MFDASRQILKNISLKKIFFTSYFLVSLLLTAAIVILDWCYKFLNFSDLVGQFFSIVPSFLGSLIAGYAILTTFTNDRYLKEMVEFERATGINFYLQTSSIFAYSIIVSVIFTIDATLFRTLLPLFHKLEPLFLDITNDVIRLVGKSATILLGFYSVLLVIAAVVNIYNWTKAFHVFLENQKPES